jgi:hypothetical protein
MRVSRHLQEPAAALTQGHDELRSGVSERAWVNGALDCSIAVEGFRRDARRADSAEFSAKAIAGARAWHLALGLQKRLAAVPMMALSTLISYLYERSADRGASR